MANDAKRTSQLGITTTLSANDRVVVLTNPASSAQTQSITVNSFFRSTAQNNFPIANSSQRGLVQVDGITVNAAANGMLSVPTANDSSLGVIKVGNNLSVNATGYLNAETAGVSISDFGEGFSLTSSDKIVTNKLYSTNESQPSQHYRLTLDTNGVVILPDQSIINGSYIRSVPGSYAGLASGPDTERSEDSWMWVDSDGGWIATDYSNNAYTWNFNNNGTLTFPDDTTYSNGTLVVPADYYIQSISNTLIQTSAAAQSKTWNFGTDGVLTLPPSGKIAFNTTPDQYIMGDMGFRIHSSDGIQTTVDREYNNRYSYMGQNLDSWEVFPEDDHSGSYPAWAWIKAELPNANTPKVFIENKRGDTGVEHRWTFDNNGVLNLPANGHVKGSVLISNTNNIYDELFRPLLNPNALDINADGGTTSTVFGPSDTVFDGGAVGTVFSIYEAALDGGVSFNNKHSASYIDGGGANQL